MSAPASSILSKKAWASSFVALFLFGSITACAEKPAPTKAASAGDTTTSKSAENHPGDEPVNTNLSAKDFDPAGISVLVEGKDYTKVAEPQPVQIAGKSEVIEFFWYGCPHCYKAETAVKAWQQSKAKDVNFTRLPAQWAPAMVQHQKLALSLQTLNKSDEIDPKVFKAIQEEGRGLDNAEKISAFMVDNGIDKSTWEQTFNSFNTNTEVAKADALFKAYKLDGVPAFVVNGKYLVKGTNARSLQVVNKLIEQDRSKK